MKRVPFNPDKLTPKQVGKGWRLMNYGELIPDLFLYWSSGRWHKCKLTASTKVKLDAECEATRRLPITQRPKYK